MKTILAAAIAAALALIPTSAAAAASTGPNPGYAIPATVYDENGKVQIGEITLNRVNEPIARTYGGGKGQNESGEWVDLLPISYFTEGSHTFTYELGGDTDLIAGVSVVIPQYVLHSASVVHQQQSGSIGVVSSTDSVRETQEISFTIPGITHYLTQLPVNADVAPEVTGLGVVFDVQVTDTSGYVNIFHYAYSAGNAGISAGGVMDPDLLSTNPLFPGCGITVDVVGIDICGQWTGIKYQQNLEPRIWLPETGQPPVNPPVVTPPVEEPPVETPPTEEPPVVTPPAEVPVEEPEPSPTPVYSELARTGAEPPYALLGAAGVLLFGGAFLILTQHHLRRSAR